MIRAVCSCVLTLAFVACVGEGSKERANSAGASPEGAVPSGGTAENIDGITLHLVSGVPLAPVGIINAVGRHLDRYFILDQSNKRILFVDNEGNVKTARGRSGRGPGEYQLPLSAASSKNGTVAIWDPGNLGITLLNEDGEYIKRVTVKWPIARLLWACEGSVLASVQFGNPESAEGVPIAMLYRPDGTLIRETQAWPHWSKDVNLSFAMLNPTVDGCRLNVMEAFGSGIGSLTIADSGDKLSYHDASDWLENTATPIMKDIKSGIPPELAVVGRWRHQGMWELGSDSLLVIQMDIERDQGQKYRYLLKTGSRVTTSPSTTVVLYEVSDGVGVFARQDDRGDVYVGSAPLAALVRWVGRGKR